LAAKPAAVFGASPGANGTARAQTQLRASFVFTDTPVLPQPEILVYRAHEKFDADGRLSDEPSRAFVVRRSWRSPTGRSGSRADRSSISMLAQRRRVAEESPRLSPRLCVSARG
jgi:hypothetical protein